MQLAATGGARLAGVRDLHGPPHIHSPPAESPMPAIRAGRLRVAAARPYEPGQTGFGLRVASLKVRDDGTTGDVQADAALRTAARVDAYLSATFGRDGIDGRGGSVELVVHAPDRTNAYWDGPESRVELGDGDGRAWGAFSESLSVMAHELYHGVIDAEVRLDYSVPEQAAIHESLADVFAAGVTGSWRIGEDVMTPGVAGDAIRDLAAPEYRHVRDTGRAGGESHALSGVASLAATRAASVLGATDMQRVWYRALVNHLVDGAGFRDAARATVLAATSMFGQDSPQRTAVLQAWESVGVLTD